MADIGTEESQLQKEAQTKFILQSKPTKSYQLTNSPGSQGRKRKQKKPKDTHTHPEACQPRQFKGPWGKGAVHGQSSVVKLLSRV